jgi:hypothetical protein
MIPLDTPKFISKESSNVHLPKIAKDSLEHALRDEMFYPVLKNRKYNLLKMKELRELYEKDRRMGRVDSVDMATKLKE